MKKFFLLTLASIGVTVAANAQKVAVAKLPAAVKAAFAKAHPTISKVSWEMEKANYEAGFTANGQEISEVYSPTGQMTEQEVEIKVSALPAAAIAYVKANFKGAKIAEAAKITKANGDVVFEAEVKGKDILFNTKGNVIK